LKIKKRDSPIVMRFPIIFFIVFSCAHINSIGQVNDSIKWSPTRKLSIEDYLAKPDPSSKFKAISYLTQPSEWTFKNDTLTVTLYCFFRKSSSWFKKENQDQATIDHLLSHEQGHFDIDEIEIRKAKRRILRNKGTITKHNYKMVISHYIKDIGYFLNERQALYDRETDYSIDHDQQIAWNEKIEKELKELEEYASEKIVIVVRK
jgi:hypothetical protein